MEVKHLDFFEKYGYAGALRLGKEQGNLKLVEDIVFENKGLDDISKILSVESEYKEYLEEFRNRINDTKYVLDLQQRYKYFLFERLCFPS